MGQSNHLPPADLPPVTEVHLQAAFTAMRWYGWGYNAAMRDPVLRKQVEWRATLMRNEEWKRTTQRTVVPVPRIKLGVDGHPVGWCMQMVNGPRAAIQQPDLLDQLQ